MVINVNNTTVNQQNSRTQARASELNTPAGKQADVAQQSAQAPASQSDSVKLSSEALNLSNIGERLAQDSDIDHDKVAKIRQSLADGSYQINAEQTAAKMVSIEEQFNSY